MQEPQQHRESVDDAGRTDAGGARAAAADPVDAELVERVFLAEVAEELPVEPVLYVASVAASAGTADVIGTPDSAVSGSAPIRRGAEDPVPPEPSQPPGPSSGADVPMEPTMAEVASHTAPAARSAGDRQNQRVARGLGLRWYQVPIWFLGRCWDFASLCTLLAVVAALPIVQLASLGYLLRGAANLAQGRPWKDALPGLRTAGKIGTFLLLAAVSWLPVWLINDLSYSAQLLQPGSRGAALWRGAAGAVTGLWLLHITWAALRGGRWWHFLWPAPLRFVREIWRPRTWSTALDRLYLLVRGLHLPHLWWLGTRGALGALVWVSIPVTMMIIGLRALELDAAGIVGILGALSMIGVMLYLPFLQIQMAADNRFWAMFQVRRVRRRFLFAPGAHALSLLLLCAASLPLYLLRIEATPQELLWAPSLVFVLFMLPAKLMLGAAMGYAQSRRQRGLPRRHWMLRWPARVVALVSVLAYVGSLYVAQLVAGQGAMVMYFQHAFLVPAPLITT